MAYNKRNWKARQGTGLNFFSIDGATPVPIVNQPTTLTEAGDALSAGNLNDWEQRIKDGFDSASGELADAVEELESEDTALKSAINANSNRIANLEQKAGDYSIVQYRGTNAVPTGKAKYGLVKTLVGKSRAWNNGAREINTTNYIVELGTDVSIADGVIDIYGNAVVSEPSGKRFSTIAGHSYLVAFEYQNTASATTQLTNYLKGDSIQIIDLPSASSFTTYAFVFACGNSVTNDTINFNIRNYSSGNLKVKGLIFRDLTTILDDWNSSDITTANIPLMVQQIPDLLKGDAYDAGSLVDTEVSGVKSVGVNIWDETTKLGYYVVANGMYDYRADGLCSDADIIVKPNTTYYTKLPSDVSAVVLFYDADGNYLNSYTTVANTSFTTPANCYVCKMYLNGYGTTYNHDVQICLNSYADKTTYHPYKSDTLSIPSPVTLRSAGSVAEVLTLETGKKTRPIGSYTFSDNDTFTYASTSTSGVYRIATSAIAGLVKIVSVSETANLLIAGYEPRTANQTYSLNMGVCLDGGDILFYDPNYNTASSADAFKAHIKGLTLYYELATPLSDEQVCDPIPDNTIYTEAGGTIDTIQTQSPVIDNCLDVGYLAV